MIDLLNAQLDASAATPESVLRLFGFAVTGTTFAVLRGYALARG